MMMMMMMMMGYGMGAFLVPLRMKRTPDQSVGSPGVRDMKTPWGQAYLRLELWGRSDQQVPTVFGRLCLTTLSRAAVFAQRAGLTDGEVPWWW